jgi:hypothetical protein
LSATLASRFASDARPSLGTLLGIGVLGVLLALMDNLAGTPAEVSLADRGDTCATAS